MAVKVMIAPAIASGALEKGDAARPREDAAHARPRRRRSSVYDADGQEVFITLVCLKCHRTRPLAQFGLRRMADGAIRNQPWCRPCRSVAGGETERRRKSGDELAEALRASDAAAPAPPPERAPARPAAALAAEVAAALAAGSRR